MTWVLCILGAYLVGSVPFGVLIGRARGVDIRQHGSKNIGATNVMRVLGRRLGYLCFALDVTKGAGPVIVAGVVNGVIGRKPAELTQSDMWLWLAVAMAAVLGHMFSLFLKFRGGKGVATGFGSMVAMWPLLTIVSLCALVVWYFVLRTTRYVAVASMAAALSLPVAYALSVIPPDFGTVAPVLLHASPPFIVTTAMALLVVFKHRGNIARLWRGEEPQAGGSARRGAIVPHDQP
jgi:glycerol-3-phosphate acyltransferase PlsY